MKRIITEGETWIYAYDRQTANEWSKYLAKGEPRPKKTSQTHSKIKVISTVISDYRGVVHYEFFPNDQTVNKVHCLSVICLTLFAVKGRNYGHTTLFTY